MQCTDPERYRAMTSHSASVAMAAPTPAWRSSAVQVRSNRFHARNADTALHAREPADIRPARNGWIRSTRCRPDRCRQPWSRDTSIRGRRRQAELKPTPSVRSRGETCSDAVIRPRVTERPDHPVTLGKASFPTRRPAAPPAADEWNPSHRHVDGNHVTGSEFSSIFLTAL